MTGVAARSEPPRACRRLRFTFLVFVLVLVSACGGSGGSDPLGRSPDVVPTMDRDAAIAAGERFLEQYVDPDGRVVRRDQGGDTVSEGQAYGMLVAVALRDRDRFETIWAWTQSHLQREDGLLSWRWAGGTVADPMPAADADVDAAHALSLASRVFGDVDLGRDATRLAEAIVAHEVVDGTLGPLLVAGPWATADGWANPSYGAPVAFAELARRSGEAVWSELDDGARRLVEASTTASDLPPDWVRVVDSAVEVTGPPSGGEPQHGYDAARTAVRLAIDCDAAGRSLAAAMDDEYDAASVDGDAPSAVLSLDGRAVEDHTHPVASVGAAAASLADGDRRDAARLLTLAELEDRRNTTYYGAAWVALGRLWLSTPLLGGCAPY